MRRGRRWSLFLDSLRDVENGTRIVPVGSVLCESIFHQKILKLIFAKFLAKVLEKDADAITISTFYIKIYPTCIPTAVPQFQHRLQFHKNGLTNWKHGTWQKTYSCFFYRLACDMADHWRSVTKKVYQRQKTKDMLHRISREPHPFYVGNEAIESE